MKGASSRSLDGRRTGTDGETTKKKEKKGLFPLSIILTSTPLSLGSQKVKNIPTNRRKKEICAEF